MDERHKPLPGPLAIPGHLLRQVNPRARMLVLGLVALLVLGAGIAVAVLAPRIDEDKQERAEREAAEAAERRAARIAEAREQMRVMRGRGSPERASAPDSTRLDARSSLLAELTSAIRADAEARARAGELDGPVLRVSCEPFPQSAGSPPEQDLGSSSGRYSCLAVKSEFEGKGGVRGVAGHSFRAKVSFASGRYAWCRLIRVPAEGSLRGPDVVVPPECGGGA